MSLADAAEQALGDRYLDTVNSAVHGRHVEDVVDRSLLERIGGPEDLNARLWFSLVREAHPDLALAVGRLAHEGGTRARIVRWLVLQGEQSSATYAFLADLTGTGTRNVKKHVRHLRDLGLVEVDDGRPAAVRLASPAVYVLATDTFRLYDDAHGLV